MIKYFLAIIALSVSVVSANAGVAPTTTYSSNSETKAFIGIQFDLGDMQPELVGGVRYTKTDTKNDVTGVKGDVALPLMGDGQFMPTMRVMGLMGSTEVQGEAGLGYNTATQQFLLGAGAQGPYVNGGMNLEMDGSLHPYIGANTLKEAPERDETVTEELR